MSLSVSAPAQEAPARGPNDQAMADLYDRAQTNPDDVHATPAPAADPQVPDWLPEKFHAAYKEDPKKALEAVTRSYAELEKGKGKPAEAAEAQPAPAEATPEQAAEAVANAGLDFGEFSAEFAQNGALSDESFEKLEKAGIGKEMVEAYIAGQKAIAEAATQTIFEAVGGQEQYTKMLQWASKSLSPDDIAAYDSAMEGSTQQVLLAVEGLQARYRAANGNEPSLLNGGNVSNDVGDVYRDTAQLQADMGSKEYATSEAFRAKVREKLGRSNIM